MEDPPVTVKQGLGHLSRDLQNHHYNHIHQDYEM